MHFSKMIPIIPCLLLLVCSEDSSKQADQWDGKINAYGALHDIFRNEDTAPVVRLDSLLPDKNLYAVGALAGLAGEVTIIGGKTYLSFAGESGTRTETPSATDAAATLLVTARVAQWQTFTTKEPIFFVELDNTIATLARVAGVNPDTPFPFLLEGEFSNLQWHVINGEGLSAGAKSHGDHQAAGYRGKLDLATATLIGFYSKNDQGIFTHAGSMTHMHCLIDDSAAMGHVDHVIIPAGTTIKFPGGG